MSEPIMPPVQQFYRCERCGVVYAGVMGTSARVIATGHCDSVRSIGRKAELDGETYWTHAYEMCNGQLSPITLGAHLVLTAQQQP